MLGKVIRKIKKIQATFLGKCMGIPHCSSHSCVMNMKIFIFRLQIVLRTFMKISEIDTNMENQILAWFKVIKIILLLPLNRYGI